MKPKYRQIERFQLLEQIQSAYKIQGNIDCFERRWPKCLCYVKSNHRLVEEKSDPYVEKSLDQKSP